MIFSDAKTMFCCTYFLTMSLCKHNVFFTVKCRRMICSVYIIQYGLPVIRICIPIGSLFSCVCGSGSRQAKMTQKKDEKLLNFMFWNTRCSLWRVEGFFLQLGSPCLFLIRIRWECIRNSIPEHLYNYYLSIHIRLLNDYFCVSLVPVWFVYCKMHFWFPFPSDMVLKLLIVV